MAEHAMRAQSKPPMVGRLHLQASCTPRGFLVRKQLSRAGRHVCLRLAEVSAEHNDERLTEEPLNQQSLLPQLRRRTRLAVVIGSLDESMRRREENAGDV